MRRFLAAFVLALTLFICAPAVSPVHPSAVPAATQGNP